MQKVLIAASSEDICLNIASILRDIGITNISITDGSNLRELFLDNTYHAALLVLPFTNELGADTALYLCRNYTTSIITFLPSKIYDDVGSKLAAKGVYTLPKKSSRSLIAHTVQTAVANYSRFEVLQQENTFQSQKVNEIKLVNRAKCVLMEYLRISEKDAHIQIQKRAMNQQATLAEIAADILKTYERS